jgi:hypothetical protein
LQKKWKYILFISIFILLLNSAGIWLVHSQSSATKEPSISKVSVDNVEVEVVNNDEYSTKIVKVVEDHIKSSMENILKHTGGVLTPNEEIQIHLSSTEDTYEINRPGYATTSIFNPDQRYLDEWNYYETLLLEMFNKNDTLSPFQTIGLAEFLSLENKKVVDYYSSHELWIIHRRYKTPTPLKEMVQADVFNRRVVKMVEQYGPSPLPQTGYWMIASFSNFLIEKYGVEKFISLYNSTDVVASLEKTYRTPFTDLEAEWTSYVKELEDNFPEKYNNDLEEDYQYWYES